jgi:hypothetical protein
MCLERNPFLQKGLPFEKIDDLVEKISSILEQIYPLIENGSANNTIRMEVQEIQTTHKEIEQKKFKMKMCYEQYIIEFERLERETKGSEKQPKWLRTTLLEHLGSTSSMLKVYGFDAYFKEFQSD